MNESSIAVILLFALLSGSCGSLQPTQEFKQNGQYLHARWLGSASALAQSLTRVAGPEANANRLAVIVLLTDLDRRDRDRIALARTSLRLCAKHLFPTTPTSYYLFTSESQVERVRSGLGEHLYSNVAVLPLDNSSWIVPPMVGERKTWHTEKNRDYRLMGDWRMTYLPTFARQMGHRYVLQLDDDSYILSPVGGNLIELFDTKGYLLAAQDVRRDPPVVTWGLPELARYFLTTHKVVPETLFEFCDPPSIEGLYSRFFRDKLTGELPTEMMDALTKLNLPEQGGWNRTVLFGNCLMYSLEWWFRPEVNRFVQLCRATGGAFTYRWNEQGVIAMLWQIFVPRGQFYQFEFKYEHRISVEQVEKLQAAGSLAGANGANRVRMLREMSQHDTQIR